MTGEGAKVSLTKLYYLSVHSLDSSDGVRYARNRVSRELLDLWIDKKISFGGYSFDDSTETLTDDEVWHKLATFFGCNFRKSFF